MCETIWFFSWENTHPSELKFVDFCPKFSTDSYLEFQGKTISKKNFRNFCANQGYPLPKLLKFPPTFCNFYFVSVLCWKNSRKYFHRLLARPITNHKKKIRWRKASSFYFQKTNFVKSRSVTYYALLLGLLVWNFYQMFFTVSIEFWLRFEPQIRPKDWK